MANLLRGVQQFMYVIQLHVYQFAYRLWLNSKQAGKYIGGNDITHRIYFTLQYILYFYPPNHQICTAVLGSRTRMLTCIFPTAVKEKVWCT